MGSKIIMGDRDSGEIYEQGENGKFLEIAALLGGNFIEVVGNGASESGKESLLHKGAKEFTEEEYAMCMFSLSSTDGSLQYERERLDDGEVRTTARLK